MAATNAEIGLDSPFRDRMVEPWGTEAYAVAVTALLLSTLVVWVHIYTKLRLLRSFAFSDYVLLLAWLLYAAGMITLDILTGQLLSEFHGGNSTLGLAIRIKRIGYINTIFRMMIFLLVKVAIIFQILRIFVSRNNRNYTFWVCHFLIWAHVIFYVTVTFMGAFRCMPIGRSWDPRMLGTCHPFQVERAVGVFNLISNITILILPQHVIWTLDMPYHRRLRVSAVFAVALLACITAAVSLGLSVRADHDDDLKYSSNANYIPCLLEVLFGFMIACSPTMPKFFAHFRGKFQKPPPPSSSVMSFRGSWAESRGASLAASLAASRAASRRASRGASQGASRAESMYDDGRRKGSRVGFDTAAMMSESTLLGCDSCEDERRSEREVTRLPPILRRTRSEQEEVRIVPPGPRTGSNTRLAEREELRLPPLVFGYGRQESWLEWGDGRGDMPAMAPEDRR